MQHSFSTLDSMPCTFLVLPDPPRRLAPGASSSWGPHRPLNVQTPPGSPLRRKESVPPFTLRTPCLVSATHSHTCEESQTYLCPPLSTDFRFLHLREAAQSEGDL